MTPPPPRVPTPVGFYIAGGFSAFFALMMGIVLFAMDGSAEENLLGRGGAAVLAALALVATEALWRARPWASRASWSLAIAYVVVVLASSLGDGGAGSAFLLLALSTFVVAPILGYVQNRSQTLFPRPHARRVAPAPPAPAAHP